MTVVDYGLGNITAFTNVYRRLGVPVTVAKNVVDLREASRLILPGVGAFDQAMKLLNQSGMREELERMVLLRKIPVLGVCVGMQMLADKSEEGVMPGLSWVPGKVKAFRGCLQAEQLPSPHMGWNDVSPVSNSKLFADLAMGSRFYFLHSYYFECETATHKSAVTSYGADFCCAVSYENIHGVQFHPEKSHNFGKLLLKNFAEL